MEEVRGEVNITLPFSFVTFNSFNMQQSKFRKGDLIKFNAYNYSYMGVITSMKFLNRFWWYLIKLNDGSMKWMKEDWIKLSYYPAL